MHFFSKGVYANKFLGSRICGEGIEYGTSERHLYEARITLTSKEQKRAKWGKRQPTAEDTTNN